MHSVYLVERQLRERNLHARNDGSQPNGSLHDGIQEGTKLSSLSVAEPHRHRVMEAHWPTNEYVCVGPAVAPLGTRMQPGSITGADLCWKGFLSAHGLTFRVS